MMAPNPLRSATSNVGADDTSLAVPSDNKLHSGPQRVLDQVHSIKRSKSKPGTPSSTTAVFSPTTQEFGAFRFSPTKANGTFGRTNSTMSTGYNKMTNRSRTLSAKTMGASRYTTSSATWDRHIKSTSNLPDPNGLKTARSDPALTRSFSVIPVPASTMRAKGQVAQNQATYQSRVNRHSTYSMTNSTQMNAQSRMVQPPSASLSHTEGRMGTIKTSKMEQQPSAVNSTGSMSDMTLKEAVEFLSHPEENYQQCGATFIHHTTFKEERTKQEVQALRHRHML